MNKRRPGFQHLPSASGLFASSLSRLSQLNAAEAARERVDFTGRERTSRKTHHLLCSLSRKPGLHLVSVFVIFKHSCSPPRFFLASGGVRRLWASRRPCLSTSAYGENDESQESAAQEVTLNNICKILDSSSSSSHLPQLLQPYAHHISPALVALVVQEQRSPIQAKLFFQWASTVIRPNEHAYHSLLRKLGAIQEFADMWKLVEDMKNQGHCVNSTTLSVIIRAYGSADMPHEAMEVFRRAHRFNVALDCQMYASLLSVLFRAKLIDDARSILEKALDSSCTFNSHGWAMLIRGFGMNGCAKEAESCWDRMLQDGVQPGLVHYNALIEGLCESKLVNKALLTLMVMQEQGFKPNAYSFNPILGALCKLRRSPEALNMFSGMKMFCAPNQATCNILLEGLFYNEDVSKACELFEKIEQDGMVDTRSYTLLTTGLKKAKERDKLLSICQNLYDKRNGVVDDVILNALLHCSCERRDVNEAMVFFSGLKNPNVASYAMMINSLCRCGKLDEALILLDDMIDRGCRPNAFCYAPLMGGILKSGRLDDGLKLFNEMVRTGIETNDITCSFLLRKLSEANMADAVLQVCRHVLDNGIVISHAVWDLALKCLETAGRGDAAFSLRRSLEGQGCRNRQASKASNLKIGTGAC